jgi:hypothetical protein
VLRHSFSAGQQANPSGWLFVGFTDSAKQESALQQPLPHGVAQVSALARHFLRFFLFLIFLQFLAAAS